MEERRPLVDVTNRERLEGFKMKMEMIGFNVEPISTPQSLVFPVSTHYLPRLEDLEDKGRNETDKFLKERNADGALVLKEQGQKGVDCYYGLILTIQPYKLIRR